MNVLTIETSTDACSIALAVGDELLIDHRVASQQHATLVLPMVDKLMAAAGLSPQQLDAVAYGRGPGSFTGVRIGIAVTQGIALGADVGVVGVSTLASIARGMNRRYTDNYLTVCVDARMDEIYFGTFNADELGYVSSLSEESVVSPKQLPMLNQAHQWAWGGSGIERYQSVIQQQYSLPLGPVRTGLLPEAQDVWFQARPMIDSGKLLPPEEAAPVYLRDKVAQTTRERQASLVK